MRPEIYSPEAIAAAFDAAQNSFGGLFPDSRPIFVVGPARSGTTIVGEAIRDGGGLPGFHEGFLFTTAYLFLTAIDARWDLIGPGVEHFREDGRESRSSRRALVRFDYDAFRAHVLRHFHELSTAAGETTWVDKTPDVYMLHAMPILASAYPRARIVFVRRNGIDVVRSRLRTHQEMAFEESCRDWATIMLGWMSLRDHLEGRAVEVEQRDVAVAPEEVARSLGAFLDFDDDQTAGIARAFATRHPGRTSTRDPQERPALGDTSWSAEQRAAFRTICGGAMTLFGYRM